MEGRVAPQERQPLVGDALFPDVEVGQIDVVDDEAVEGRPGYGGRAGHRLRDVVLPRVDGLLGERRRSKADEERALLLPCLVDGQRVEGRRRQHVARPDVELGPVAGADDHALVELAACEGALLVGAGVVEGDPAARGSPDADRAALDLDLAERPRRLVAGGADRVPGGLSLATSVGR